MSAEEPPNRAPRMADAARLIDPPAPARAFGNTALMLAVAGLLALLALGLAQAAHPLAATLAAMPAAALALTALWKSGVWRLSQGRNRGQIDALSQLLADDPDPVCVTDAEGRPIGANPRAADQPDPASRLWQWSVDPARLVAALLQESAAQGCASRVLRRSDQVLRLTLHRIGGDEGLILWRFSPLQAPAARSVDQVGLPLVSRDARGITANAAARSLFDAEDPGQWAALAEAVTSGPVDLGLPGGLRAQAVPFPAPDGGLDIVILTGDSALSMPARAGGQGQDFDDLPVAMAQIGADGRIGATNRLARSLLGLEPGHDRFFWEVVEGLGRPVPDWLDDARAGRALGRPEVVRATLAEGESFVQVILRRGAPGTLVAVISDATELKSLEARFVQSQKMQAIGQLAGGIAHDFNNLLTAISGHCDLLLLNRDRFDPDHDDLLQIHQNANRAAALVRQLLAFSRKQTLKTEVLTLESLLEELTHLLTRLVGERITLKLSHDPDLGAIRADRRQLEQVVMNLVVNARDAMPMGGAIRIETRALRLTEELAHGRARVPPGSYALIRVIDEGVGIPPDIIDKIFEPFFTTKKLGEGTGLGLSTAYGIVKQMGGFIFCDSVEGSGTVFSLYFAQVDAGSAPVPRPAASRFDGTAMAPTLAHGIAPRPPRPVPALPEPAAAAGRGRSILLVEDEAPVRAFAARALRHQGYQVFEAQDGEQALEFLQDATLRIDLFVTDVVMPGIDGPGWVTRALANRPGTPVVFVSGYTEDTLSAALTRIPRAVFLGKPFSLRDLSETIARQLSG